MKMPKMRWDKRRKMAKQRSKKEQRDRNDGEGQNLRGSREIKIDVKKDLGHPVPLSAGFSSSLVPGWKSIL